MLLLLLQSELYEARTLYAKAIAVRDALEARTTRAEAEKAAAEGSLQQARTQVCGGCRVPLHKYTDVAQVLYDCFVAA